MTDAEPDAEPTAGAEPTERRTRRRASRAAGPTGGEAATAATVHVETPSEPVKRRATPLGPPPRRAAHRRLVGVVALTAGLVGIAALTAGVGLLFFQQRDADAQRTRDQRFVDTATQTVVNMFSYTQETIDESVTRAVEGTSGPLRGMLSSNAENIKTLYRHTDATSEVVVNGAALEGVDDVTDNASVLVSVRVTVTDLDGVNKPSSPYRMRVIVHQDDAGRMTGYDLKYPEGGN